MEQFVFAAGTVIVGVVGCIGYFFVSNMVLDFALPAFATPRTVQDERRSRAFRAIAGLMATVFIVWIVADYFFGSLSVTRAGTIGFYLLVFAAIASAGVFALTGSEGSVAHVGSNITRANAIRPWLFLFPALLLLGVYLVYPVFVSIYLSFMNSTGQSFVGLANYQWMIADGKFRESLVNNLLWLIVVPALSTMFGLLAAALTDRIKWGNFAKAMIFMPMAISMIGAAVIWKLVYEYRDAAQPQIGLLNEIVVQLGGVPQTWLTQPGLNSFLLMAVLVWVQTGFAMVILSAALRGIPEETVEAAVLDGASPVQIFFKIKVPQIWGTILVVWTTITITVLKVFDIVYAMTNGQWGTQVLANLMYDWMFRANDSGRASVVALVIMLLVTPVMVWNIRNARKEMR